MPIDAPYVVPSWVRRTRVRQCLAVIASLSVSGCEQILGLDEPTERTTTSPSSCDAGAAQYYEEAVLADGPSGYWRLDETSTTMMAEDTSMHMHPGTYVGDVQLGVDGAIAGDAAAAFDLNTDVVSMGDVFSFPGVASFTLEAWIAPHELTLSSAMGIASKEKRVTAGRQGYYAAVDAQKLSFARTRDDYLEDVNLFGTFPNDEFTYVVATFDGSTMCLYANGKQQKACEPGTNALLDDNGVSFVIGAGGISSQVNVAQFWGTIDEVAVYAKALAPDRIAAHYAARCSP